MARKVILYIATSLDGYIATRDEDLAFLSLVELPGEDYGYHDFIRTVDTVILGRKTYDKVLSFGIGFPHADKECYIVTRTQRTQEGNVRFYTGDIKTLVTNLKEKEGKNIFVDGGADVVNTMMKDDLIDEFVVSVIPVFLGDGIRLFQDGRPEHKLELMRSESFEKGLVQLRYKRKRGQ
ncbi:dihydrofolate reductase family protein [Dyadobacter sp. 676]|uniref:Dihydrofolate reductase family protein n=1 Tax=Dyadobacter sp. 676 TaxID=3088362 RepID=A0AAU8FCU1_9BACT